MKGFKVTNPDYSCRNVTFEVGKEYSKKRRFDRAF